MLTLAGNCGSARATGSEEAQAEGQGMHSTLDRRLDQGSKRACEKFSSRAARRSDIFSIPKVVGVTALEALQCFWQGKVISSYRASQISRLFKLA